MPRRSVSKEETPPASVGGISITNHAYQRAKERMNLGRKAFKRTVQIAWEQGHRFSSLPAPVRRYVVDIYYVNKTINKPRVYGEYLYLFENTTLVTIYRIPNEYTKYL